MKPMPTFFTPIGAHDASQQSTQNNIALSAVECVKKLEDLYDKTKTVAGASFLQICVLLKFFELRTTGSSRRQAATIASSGMPAKLNRHARTIQFWAHHFETRGALPVFIRGKHQKTESLMHDENFMAKCAEWLHAQLPNERSPQRFQRHLNMEVIPLLTGALEANLSESTARRWMQHIGYRYGLWKKNVYTDGHEREDVTAYRERFCKLFLSLAEDEVLLWRRHGDGGFAYSDQ
ncbi:hypothetical protein DYB28_006874 [Aphanomyces astaci]|nr:hypothetical protein DYB38_011269 [Aphanomyces astaci]RHY43379.1 hypothetical protein DYB30_008664 [Aphanomyces astaci]RHZ02597.1 hypothetical protein DYB26_002184 [Aphanomyces astaci]RLO05870.1 hypothetical protein DYB28_006874 [Aphanomyces astaci]